MAEASREAKITFRKIAQRIRVPAGFILAPLLVIAARPTVASLIAGSLLALVGLMIRAWASGHLKKNQELSVAGPYAYTRNPLYLGTFIMGTGVAVGTGTPWFVALFMALYLLIYLPVMSAEADYMRELFPNHYSEYSRRVPLFFPRLTPFRPVESAGPRTQKSFDGSLYMRHREYRAAIGVAFVLGVLVAKYYFRI